MYGRDRYDGRRRRGGPITLGVKLIAGGIGLASESIKGHKQHKLERSQSEQQDSNTIVDEGQRSGHENHSSSIHDVNKSEDTERNDKAYSDPPPSYDEINDIPSRENYHTPSEKGKNPVGTPFTAGDVEKGDEITKEDESIIKEEHLDNEWDLDDAQDEILGQDSMSSTPSNTSPEQSLDTFLQAHPSTFPSPPQDPLELPVVIPQRRPRDRS